jgi:cytochrome c oxidase subunit 1
MSVGVMGMRRRIADYDPQLGVEFGHVLITVAGFAIALSILLMIYNLLHSSEVGVRSGNNPWHARSPEWQIPSPVPEHSFATPLRVVGEPYDYGLRDGGYVVMTQATVGDD